MNWRAPQVKVTPRMKMAYNILNYLEKRCSTHIQQNGKHVYVPDVRIESQIQKYAHIISQELQASQQLCLPVEPLWSDSDDSTGTNETKIQQYLLPDETNPP